MDVFLKFVFIKESSDFGVLYVVCLATNARLHHQDQYCPYGVLQFPSGFKTSPSGDKTNPLGFKTNPSGDK